MAIIIKTEEQIGLIRESCRRLAMVHNSELPPLQRISRQHLRVRER